MTKPLYQFDMKGLVGTFEEYAGSKKYGGTVTIGDVDEEAEELKEELIQSKANEVFSHCDLATNKQKTLWYNKARPIGVDDYYSIDPDKKCDVYIPKPYVHTLIIPFLCGSQSRTFIVPERVNLYDKHHWHHCDVYRLKDDGTLIKAGWKEEHSVGSTAQFADLIAKASKASIIDSNGLLPNGHTYKCTCAECKELLEDN